MLIDFDLLRDATVSNDPFDHVVVPGVIRKDALDDLHRDDPDIGRPVGCRNREFSFRTRFGRAM